MSISSGSTRVERRYLRHRPTSSSLFETCEHEQTETIKRTRSVLLPKTPKIEEHVVVVVSNGCSAQSSINTPRPPTSGALSIKSGLAEEVKEPVLASVLYGFINVAIVLPVTMSFATVIYINPAYNPYMSNFVKLTVLSGAIHQLSFSALSTLPFAVGQVQDAGLIFLTSMATTIVDHCKEKQHDDQVLLATSTIVLSLCTTLLGLSIVLVAKCKLASYVQMLPTPIVAGYLAFIGFFCGQTGVSLMAPNIQIDNWAIMKLFFPSQSTILHVLPGILGGCLIYILINKRKSMFVLPGCIIGMLLIFHFILYLSNTSLKEAQEHGWIGDPSPFEASSGRRSSKEVGSWDNTWDYLQFHLVDWTVLPKLIFTQLSMITVVALSSSLDVLAIEIELGQPTDINRELSTVGWSNVLSGLFGGYTGSYIFSQSIFSLKSGVRRRVNGLVVALCELLVVFVLPVSPFQYIPTFFFGSLLIMIALDLIIEWLYNSKERMTEHEYFLNILTFALIQLFNVEYGVLAGLVIYFLASKCGANVAQPLPSSTNSTEDDEEYNKKQKSNKNNGNKKGGSQVLLIESATPSSKIFVA